MQQEMLPLFTSVDLFAGCGGLTRGLEDSGFRCLAFNEINKDAADSFALNFPDAIRLDGDIREAVSNEINSSKSNRKLTLDERSTTLLKVGRKLIPVYVGLTVAL